MFVHLTKYHFINALSNCMVLINWVFSGYKQESVNIGVTMNHITCSCGHELWVSLGRLLTLKSQEVFFWSCRIIRWHENLFLEQGSDMLVALMRHPTLKSASCSLKDIPERKFTGSEESGSGRSRRSKCVYIFQREYATVDPALVDVCYSLFLQGI